MPCFLVLRPPPLLNIQLRLASLSTFCRQLYTCMIRMVHDQFEFVVKRATSELVLGDNLPEPDTLVLGDVELERTRLAASIRTRDRTRTPRRS